MTDRQDEYKIDLHTHSIVSYDGGITARQYENLFEKRILDCVAITDHNETRFARMMQEKLGEKIIVGEEITTVEGELIGLFLQQTIPAGQTVEKTVEAIKEQGGLVYIPHPFETIRKGLQRSALEKIISSISIVEVFNARARWRGKQKESEVFADASGLAKAASSDAHGFYGVGTAFNIVTKFPKRNSLKKLLEEVTLQKEYAPLWTYLYPAMNKIKNKIILQV
jgi:predicted metal-dependent phosphoesterase TrpH